MEEERRFDWRPIILIVAIGIVFSFAVNQYNGLVRSRNQVLSQQGQIEETYQRRLELLSDMVKSVQKYTDHEEEVFKAIADAHAALTTAVESGNLNEMEERNAALTNALDAALVLIEDNPEIQAKELYIQLNDEIAGSENRISQARYKYNELVEEYNNKVETYPGLLYAKLFGFKKFDYIQADRRAHSTSVVNFD